MRQMRRHARHGVGAAQLEKRTIAGGVELQNGRAVLKAFSPLGPAARGVLAVHGEHRCTMRRAGRGERANLRRRHREQAIDGGNEIGGCAGAVEADHDRVTCQARHIIYDPLTSTGARLTLARPWRAAFSHPSRPPGPCRRRWPSPATDRAPAFEPDRSWIRIQRRAMACRFEITLDSRDATLRAGGSGRTRSR